jgi:prevent-host-death family protein
VYRADLHTEVFVATQVNMLEAKNQLSKLVKKAVQGEQVVIASNGVPMVRLTPMKPRVRARKPGAWSKLPAPAPDWDSPAFNRQIANELAGRRAP